MRRKRFKHHVHIFCHMFCGWQLANDLDELSRLSAGRIEINVKTGQCRFNGEVNSKLTMPLVLNDWFLADLKEHNIGLSNIDTAELVVNFNMNEFRKRNGLRPEFHCSSKLVAGLHTYTLSYQGEQAGNEVNIT